MSRGAPGRDVRADRAIWQISDGRAHAGCRRPRISRAEDQQDDEEHVRDLQPRRQQVEVIDHRGCHAEHGCDRVHDRDQAHNGLHRSAD